jgi:ATP-dependent RNA helicase RhlE
MLDMGFLPDVRRIVEQISTDRQTLLFSATLPPEIDRLAAWVLRDPVVMEIGANRSPAETVTHAVYPVASDQKFDLLIALLERTNFDSCLIFSRTKHGADKIAVKLKQGKHSVAVLHSNRTQRERVEALEGFKSGKYEIMVATDIAARGIDIAGISHVINYDVPEHSEDYVTGSVGRVAPRSRRRVHAHERRGTRLAPGDRAVHWREDPAAEARRLSVSLHRAF